MTPKGFLGLVIVVASVTAAAQAASQTPERNAVVYELASKSDFQWGCFAPCLCPVLVRQPLLGSFELTKLRSDPLFDYYAVTDVRWSLSDSTTPVSITGSGMYRRGGEVALVEQLTLDLSFDGGEPQRFDSGLVPPHAPFPGIETTISIHGVFCFDSAISVVAKPVGTVSVGVASTAKFLTVIPSPFRSSIQVEFSLSREGSIDLGVFDVTGREVCSLAHGEWLTAGQHRAAWDGMLASGRTAPPGLYFIRLGTIDGLRTRAVVKLQ